METKGVLISDIIEHFDLINLTPDVKGEDRYVKKPEISRPSLFLAGYYKDFSYERIQIVGGAEYNYTKTLTDERYSEVIHKLFEYDIPCIIFCRDNVPDDSFLNLATSKNIPILCSSSTTSSFSAELNRWLTQKLAPRKSIHGTLVEVYGVGLLITGESGIGKSEAALELVRRGHRLVSDDLVEVHKVNGDLLVGESPSITRYFLEVRGIGIIDIKTLYGVDSVKTTKTIELVVNLEEWKKKENYDRTGLDSTYVDILGLDIEMHNVPVKPGRNIAVILETAAVNYRQRKLGYDTTQDLKNRIEESEKNQD